LSTDQAVARKRPSDLHRNEFRTGNALDDLLNFRPGLKGNS